MATDNLFSADQVIGKTLVAQKRINVRTLPETTATVLFITEPGQTVGTVYSYVQRSGKVWWQIELSDKKSGWCQHNQGWYSLRALKQQGAKTVSEQVKEKEEKEKSLTDKFGDFFAPTGTFLKYAIPIGAFIIGFILIDKFLPGKFQTRATR
jgi:hypothetical protein